MLTEVVFQLVLLAALAHTVGFNHLLNFIQCFVTLLQNAQGLLNVSQPGIRDFERFDHTPANAV